MELTSASESATGLVASSQEAGDARRVLDDVPKVVVEFHLDQHIAGQEDALDGVLLAVAQLGDRLGGDHDAADAVLQAEGLDAALQRLAHLALKAGVGVDDVPLEILVDRRGKLLGGLLAAGVLRFRNLLVYRHGECAFSACIVFDV